MIPAIAGRDDRPPRLRIDLAQFMLDSLPPGVGPTGSAVEKLGAAAAAGYAGIQGGDPALVAAAGLSATGAARVDRPGDAARVAAEHQAAGFAATTLHVGTGLESDAEVDALVSAVIEASSLHGYPLLIETHRATVTQDLWRTVEITRRHPEVRFNGDFSHWYTGLEMVYGDFEARLAFAEPVFARVRFLHGRIGHPGAIQVALPDGDEPSFVRHFREMWTRAMMGFLRTAGPGDILPFTLELLPPDIFYAPARRAPNGNLIEDGDRWSDGLRIAAIARECFAEAQRRLNG